MINKILKMRDFSEKEIRLIKKSYKLALKSHKGQKRYTEEPYIEHVLDVALMLAKWKQDAELICVGLLHDIVEDCDVTLDQIKKGFGDKVAKLVDGLSFVTTQDGKRNMDATYKKFLKIAQKYPEIVLVSAADRLNNTSQYSNNKYTKENFCKQNKEFYIPLFKHLGIKKVVKKLKKATNKYSKQEVKIALWSYINKKEMISIKKKLNIKQS